MTTTDTNAPAALALALPPSIRLPEYAQLAERLGYQRVWVFDSPALYGDVWVAIARAAEATERIGFGTGVAVPTTRHVVTTASAIATIAELAPGRLVAAFGTGFTARMAMGKKPISWASLERYVETLRTLLAGGVADVDGAKCQLIYSPGYGPARPIDVPLLLAPMGPKGFAAARRTGDGVVLTGMPGEPLEDRWNIRAMLTTGTVLQPGEDHTSDRVRDAAGPFHATGYHAIWEWAPAALANMPGGAEWLSALEAERPEGERHLAVHEGHFVTVTDRDRPLLDAGGPAILSAGWTGDAASIQQKLAAATAAGITEVLYSPAGSDIAGEIEAFAAAARS